MARVLVVDDEPAVRSVVEQTMIRFGHDVMTAIDGVDALEKLSSGQFDLVITDMMMPNMDGVELISHMQERYPDVKIIAISGGGINHTPQDCLGMAIKAGALKTLGKPFVLSTLSSMTKELLDDAPSQPLSTPEGE